MICLLAKLQNELYFSLDDENIIRPIFLIMHRRMNYLSGYRATWRMKAQRRRHDGDFSATRYTVWR